MPEFATFDPSRPELAPLDIVIEPLSDGDVDACAMLAARREGASVAKWRESFGRDAQDDERIVLVARNAGRVVGYGRAAQLEPGADGAKRMPAGWYLTGVVVDPRVRRRGVARSLAEARLDALRARGVEVAWCFIAVANRASLLLHESVGFVEVTRDFEYPGVSFSGGQGVLMRWDDAVS